MSDHTMECIVILAVLGAAVYFLTPKTNYVEKKISVSDPDIPINNFPIRNHYKVPVDIHVSTPITPSENTHGENVKSFVVKRVEPGKGSYYNSPVINGSVIKIYLSNPSQGKGPVSPVLLEETVINIPEGKAIRAIHTGLMSSHYDISISSDPIKSPLGNLGSAIPRLRIVNTSSRTLRLNGNIVIPSRKSFMYMGEFGNGIPIGTILKDQDGYLHDFKIDRPISDLFMGITSDINVPLYTGAKLGNQFDDTTGTTEFILFSKDSQTHRGSNINKAYLPL